MPVYFQALNWLNETTHEPLGGWRILSLTLNEEKCDPDEMVDCYTLWAHTDDDRTELTAELFFPYETEPSRPRVYEGLEHGQVRD